MDLLTQHETAGATRLSERTLERHRLAGTGPKFVRLGRRVFYRRHDVDEWIVEHVCRSTSEAGTKTGRGDDRDVQCENSGGAAAVNVQPGISQDVEQPDHPRPPSAEKDAPFDSERYRVRNQNAEFSSAPIETARHPQRPHETHQKSTTGDDLKRGSPGTIAGIIGRRR